MPNLNIMDINYRPCLIECDVSLFEPESETEPQHYDKACVEEVKQERTITENRFPKVGNFRCDMCTSVVSTQTQLDNHKKIHAKGSVKFYCEECDKCYASNRNLVRHLKSHSKAANKIFKIEERTESIPSFLPQVSLEKPSSDIKKEQLESISTTSCELNRNLEKNYDCENSLAKFTIRNFKCDKCPSIVSTQKQLDNHMKIHELGSIKFSCEKCDKCFASNKNLVRHQKSHSTSENEIKLEERIESSLPLATQITLANPSNEIKKEQLELMPHPPYKIMLGSDKSYACQKCSAKFSNQSHLDGHMRAHDGKTFNCKKCDRCFVTNRNLQRHLKLHLKQSQYSNFSTGTMSKCVVKLKRMRWTRGKLDCKICLKRFSQLKYLNQHTRRHSIPEQKYECPTCKKVFNRKNNLTSHMKVHDEKKIVPEHEQKHLLCVFCGRKFQDSSSLAVHTRRHTGEKPFKCEFCDKGFPRTADLITHRRVHTGEKPHLCNICGKSFSKSNKLTRHMRTHTGDRPYHCTYCERAFAQSNDLTIHIRRHTGEKPYACGICGERFIQRTVLEHHRKVKGHYEDVDGVVVPYAHLSQNNPNPKNKSNRVDQIGKVKPDDPQKTNFLAVNKVDDIKPLQMEVIDLSQFK